MTTEYKAWITELKTRFQQAQIKAAVKVNSTLLEFYWELGSDIVEKQKNAKWGSGFLKQLSADLMHEFPDVKGFSVRNVHAIKKWYLFWNKEVTKVQQVVAQLGCSLNDEEPEKRTDFITSCYSNVEQVVPHLKRETSANLVTACYPNPITGCYENEKLSPMVREIGWSLNLSIMSRCKTRTDGARVAWKRN